jgi:catechol 2,3-dioxygenase-like lactoylglutathione lyase family enzyme
MIQGLRTVLYPVAHLDVARRWYADLLGQEPYFDQPFYVGFAVGGFELGLLPDGQPGTDGAQALWGVADIAVAFTKMLTLGATELEPVSDVGGGIKVAAVRDPFGNRLGLIENPHFDVKAVR